jgi:diguanylate cyclase (GGDEF)-like protein
MNVPDVSAVLRTPSMVQLGQRLLFAIGLAVAVTVAIWLWVSWQQVREVEVKRMGTTVQLLAAHADNYFAAFEQRMQGLARELRRHDPLADPDAVLPLLRSFKSGHPDILGAGLVHPDGRILVSTAGPERAAGPSGFRNDPVSSAELDCSLQSVGLSVSRPQTGKPLPSWVIHLRYTVRDTRHAPRYLIQTGILLERQQELWRALELGPDVALGLLRDDGYLISRIPDSKDRGSVYASRVGGALFAAMREAPERGSYEGAVVDGSYRLGTYQRLTRLPVHVFLSHERRRVIGIWWSEVRWPLLLVLGSMLLSFVIYLLLARRYSRRMREIEEQLTFGVSVPAETLPSSGVKEIDTLVAALTQSREKLRAVAQNREHLLLSATEAGIYAIRERDGILLTADAAFAAMLGRPAPELVGRPWEELVEERPDESADSEGRQELARRIVQLRLPSGGHPRWLSVAEYREILVDGNVVRHGLAIDVSDREQLLNRVNLQSQRLEALWQLATARGKTDSEKMQLMLGLALDALRMDMVLVNELAGDSLIVREVVDDLRLFQAGQEFPWKDSLCRRVIRSQASVIVADLRTEPELRSHPFVEKQGLYGFASIPIFAGGTLYGTMVFMRRAPLGEDFGADERTFMELLAAWFGQLLLETRQRLELQRMAMTDGLTRLINRRAAETRFQEELARARRSKDTFSIAVCDLDRFKLINDQYGHDTGDQVLVQVAEIMKAHLREGDWVARWGGEEFIIFLHQAEPPAAFAAMERLRLAIKGHPVSTAHGPLDITTSIGIGTFRGEGDLASVLSEADGCLYEAKHAGRDAVVISGQSRHGTLWKAGMLQHALIENRIVPAYQVIVDLRTRQVVADETLARLIDSEGRIVPAHEFIEAAEGINLIHVVDEVVSRQSLQRCALDMRAGHTSRDFAHFINLSPQFLARRELVQAMLSQAAQHCVECDMVGEPVKPVVLEITERQLLGNFEDLMKDLQPLLDFGFRLALDDFGSGYSSFLYLASLPVSFLKIEGWMVRHLRDNPKVLAMVRGIIRLARDQGITTIAECVEDAATADLLTELGVDWGQGWYFGRPQCEVDPAEVLRPLRTGTQ